MWIRILISKLFQVTLTISFLLTSVAGATSLNCEIRENGDLKHQVQIQTSPDQKVQIGETAWASAYVTEESKDRFSLEAYLPQYDVRIFSQGSLAKPADQLSAGFWGRLSLIDMKCRRSVE